jgi:glucose-6-phosphate 1-dehydrogenase
MTVPTAPAPARESSPVETLHPAALIILGATGDLSRRRLLPAVYNLAHDRSLPDGFALVGLARDELSDARFRELAAGAIRRFSRRPPDEQVLADLLARARYLPGRLDADATYDALGGTLATLDRDAGRPLDRCFHLAIPPGLVGVVVARLGEHGLARREGAAVRVVIEKPFGTTLAGAKRLNREVRAVLSERQIFRIDHLLGTETVQNLLALRFANTMFEPLWNRNHVDHVEITAAEDLGIEGRAEYYDAAGALRDLVQNHLLQVLCHVAMEPPGRFGARQLSNEKVKVLDAVAPPPPPAAVRGQYTAGIVGGRPVPGYLDEPGVAPGSRTETYAALRVDVDNWRWAGVPFYLRTGKRLARAMTEIAVTLRPVPHMGFAAEGSVGVRPNVLILTIGPAEGLSLMLAAKIPGARMRLRPVKLELPYELAFGTQPPAPYERLVLDALRGDATLFTRSDEVEAQWRIVDPILEAWQARDAPPAPYPAGSPGPAEAEAVLLPGHAWRSI